MSLTSEQQTAFDQVIDWLFTDNGEQQFVLSGAAGTGKSYILSKLDQYLLSHFEVCKNLNIPEPKHGKHFYITATTNNAVDHLVNTAFPNATTLHTVMGWKVQTNLLTGVRSVHHGLGHHHICQNSLLVIDEASMVCLKAFNALQALIQETHCKILYVCDLAQLPPVNEQCVPFVGLPTIDLKTIVRNTNQSFQKLLMEYRENILNHRIRYHFDADNIHHLSPEDFKNKLVSNNSIYLTYTNKNSLKANNYVLSTLTGSTDVQVGQILTVNTIPYGSGFHVGMLLPVTEATKTFLTVKSYEPSEVITIHGFKIQDKYFIPEDYDLVKKVLKKLRLSKENYSSIAHLETTILDARHQYAMTINKAQGQTIENVFIDLSSLRCIKYNPSLLQRLIYVALSRASHNVYLTGSL